MLIISVTYPTSKKTPLITHLRDFGTGTRITSNNGLSWFKMALQTYFVDVKPKDKI